MRFRSPAPPSFLPQAGIPAYFYPYPGDPHWATLAESPAGTIVVITPDNGPGRAPDPNYLSAVANLRESAAVLYGYVDSAYAARDPALLLAEVATYREWYGIDGVFVDQVEATADNLDAYSGLVRALQKQGLPVALNPGQPVVDRRYAGLADQLLVFEGTFADYSRCEFPRWMTRTPKERLWHLVYEVFDEQQLRLAQDIAVRNNAGTFFATDGRMPNPWDRLPGYWPGVRSPAD